MCGQSFLPNFLLLSRGCLQGPRKHSVCEVPKDNQQEEVMAYPICILVGIATIATMNGKVNLEAVVLGTISGMISAWISNKIARKIGM